MAMTRFALVASLVLCGVGCGEDGTSAAAGGGGAPPAGAGAGAGPAGQPGCGLDAAAFCETFDTPHPGGRGGEIDETRFAFSRYHRDRIAAYTFPPESNISAYSNPHGPPLLCGEPFSDVVPPNDVRVCGGHLEEMFNDAGGIPINSFMVRQPFDFTGRTGAVMFDVDAKRNDGWDGHGWWLEVWITEHPAPIPYHDAPTIQSSPRNAIGFQISAGDAFEDLTVATISGLAVVRDGEFVRDILVSEDGSAGSEELDGAYFKVQDQALNRFRIELSQDEIRIFSSDHDAPDDLRLAAHATELGLTFSTGYVHFQHVHYNAGKTPTSLCQCVNDEKTACLPDCSCAMCADFPNGFFASQAQTYRWDNIAFDGPVHPAPRAYDVPDSLRDWSFPDGDVFVHRVDLGYHWPGPTDLAPGRGTLELHDVDPTDAAHATFNFNAGAAASAEIRFRFNGGTWQSAVFVAPDPEPVDLLRTYSAAVPIADLRAGTNTVELESTADFYSNLDLTINPSR
jgi:hypothetical protein